MVIPNSTSSTTINGISIPLLSSIQRDRIDVSQIPGSLKTSECEKAKSRVEEFLKKNSSVKKRNNLLFAMASCLTPQERQDLRIEKLLSKTNKVLKK